jgi:26S proteasome regulatory subunit N2
MMSLSMPTATAPSAVATASGYIALLQETDLTLRSHALTKLLEVVDSLWHEVAESLPDLEAVAEDMDLPVAMRQTAAAVASRVFFHLEESHQALRLALEAGEQHFDPMLQSPYVERLVAAALDAYVAARCKLLGDDDDNEKTSTVSESATDAQKKSSTAAAAATTGLPFDQLQAMVHRLLQSSCEHGKYDHALGIALEARETDKVRDILKASGPSVELLKYALNSAVTVVSSKAFRQETLAVVAECLTTKFVNESVKSAAYDLILVHQLLKQAPPVASVLVSLFKGSEPDALLGLQLCFDLMDSGDSAFCKTVAEQFQAAKPVDEEFNDRWTQAEKVLVGGFPSELALSFLYKNSHADRLIMENLKKALEERSSGSRSSVLHTAAVVTHSYLYAGTTNDSFLRDFLDWMKKASNWYVPFFVYCFIVYSLCVYYCRTVHRLL